MRTFAKAAVAAAFVSTGVASFAALAQTNNPGGSQNNYLGDMDYGVCRGVDPKCFHDWKRTPTTDYRVLLFTKTAGPRHANIGTPLPPGMNPPLAENNVVQRELGKLLAANGIKMDYTEDLAQFGRIDGYQAIIFFSTSRDNLDDASKTALRQYMRRGGGFVGVHNAFGTLYNWPYYEGLLGGANYFDHPGGNREGDVVIQDKNDISTKGIPARFHFKDEWYNLVPFPTHVRFLATVDDKSIVAAAGRGGAPGEDGAPAAGGRGAAAAPGAAAAGAPAAAGTPGAAAAGGRGGRGGAPGGPVDTTTRYPRAVGEGPGHGAFHPVAWCQYYDGGKSWVTTLGHDGAAWTDPNFAGGKEFKSMLLGGIKSVMGLEPFCK